MDTITASTIMNIMRNMVTAIDDGRWLTRPGERKAFRRCGRARSAKPESAPASVSWPVATLPFRSNHQPSRFLLPAPRQGSLAPTALHHSC
jgi:hypothetical protein